MIRLGETIRPLIATIGKQVLRSRGYRLQPAPRVLIDRPGRYLEASIGMVCAYHALQHPDGQYLYIGAFDGVTSDPLADFIHRLGWKGILVEPQPSRFADLKRNLGHLPGLTFENVAIARESGSVPMYRIRDDLAMPAHFPRHLGRVWLDQLASLDFETIARNLTYCCPDLEPSKYIESFQVPALSIQDLLDRHSWSSVDLVQVDAEGFDYEIIRMLRIPNLALPIIHYEHHHLSLEDREECARFLVDHGYRLSVNGLDTLAYRNTRV